MGRDGSRASQRAVGASMPGKGDVVDFEPSGLSCAKPGPDHSCSHDYEIRTNQTLGSSTRGTRGAGKLDWFVAGLCGSADVSHRDAGVVAAPACRSRGLGTSSTWQTCPHRAGGLAVGGMASFEPRDPCLPVPVPGPWDTEIQTLLGFPLPCHKNSLGIQTQ